MTQSGEVITIKGEYADTGFNEGTYSYYSTDCSREKNYPDGSSGIGLVPGIYMLFLLKGNITFLHPGKKKPALCCAGQQHNLLYLNKELLMQLQNTEQELVLIHLDQSFLVRYLPLAHPGYLSLMEAVRLNVPAAFAQENLKLSPEIFMVLDALSASPHKGFCGKLFLESKILELLLLQLSQFEQAELNHSSGKLKKEELDKMYKVKELLTAQLDSQFSLRSLAHMVGTNEFNLKRDFKVAFGTTVFSYLNAYKMASARRMLMEKELSVAEVAEKMGYKYATHFSSAFKKFFGYLPNRIKSGKLSWLLFLEDFSVLYENIEVLIGCG
jgi:AraC-like DNA-binding protein